jgi:hypothetical protein
VGNTSSDTTTSEEQQNHQSRPQILYCRRCSNRAAIDCDNQMCGRHCVLCGWYSCARHNTIR